MFAFQVLPVNYAGLALILLGLMFMVAEAFMPSFGILGIGGVVAFIAGSVMLWEETGPGFTVPIGIIGGFGLGANKFYLLQVHFFTPAVHCSSTQAAGFSCKVSYHPSKHGEALAFKMNVLTDFWTTGPH